MDHVPAPLRAGTPVSLPPRSSSSSVVLPQQPPPQPLPSPLQVASPVVASGPSPFARPPSTSANPHDRLSQLFPTRSPSLVSPPLVSPPSSNVSPLPLAPPLAPASRRQSGQVSPLTPPGPDPASAPAPAYTIPAAPAPPTFSATAYDPFSVQHSPPPVLRAGGPRGLFDRLNSFRNSAKRGKYGVLEDQDEHSRSAANAPRGRLDAMAEDEEAIGYDISGLAGLPMREMTKKQRKQRGRADTITTSPSRTVDTDQEQLLLQAGLAAEYDRLESAWKTGGLGGGMQSAIEAPFPVRGESTTAPATALTSATGGGGPGADHGLLHPNQHHHHHPVGHRRGESKADVQARENARRTAEKTGEMVVVEIPSVDISALSGSDFEARNSIDTSAPDTKKSYYFPDDPDKPSWKPFTMQWPYMSTLIILALALAGIQEWLYQLSVKRAKEGTGIASFKSAGDLSITQYFTWKYAPTLILVTYGILWQTLDFEVKRLEPYFQLSKRNGTTAAESLNIDYLTFFSYLTPLKALRYRQWAVVYCAVATLTAGSLVPILQSASVIVYPDKKDRKDNELKHIRIDGRWSRPVTACLIFVALCGCILLFQLRRKSGLLCDPKGIAGVAAMATRSHILYDFNGLDTTALPMIHKQLRHRRYILHKSSLWQGEYVRSTSDNTNDQTNDPRPMMLRRRAGFAFVGFMILFAISIPIFMFNQRANDLTDKVPWLLVAIATLVKLLWSTIDCDIRLLEPYYILSRRNAPASSLTLDYTGTIPGWLSIKAAMAQHYMVTFVSVGALLTEVLTVCVSSFGVDGRKFLKPTDHDENEAQSDSGGGGGAGDETFKSFWVSFVLVMLILLYLCIGTAIVHWRRGTRFTPHQLGTIASVLSMISQSKMLLTFIDTERMNSTEMAKHLEEGGKRYALGWFTGLDGKMHCGIDHEPILAPFEWGKDFRETRMEGNQIGAWEHYERVT